MWFDSHCHIDAPEFEHDRDEVIQRAKQAGLAGLLVPAVQARDFDALPSKIAEYAEVLPCVCFTLGIHPLFTNEAIESDIELLDRAIQRELSNPRFIGIGEIGLDYFVDFLDDAKQEWFFERQLMLAEKYKLPVILHVRRSQDQLLKRLRKVNIVGGIAHAFNGSFQQAHEFLKLNMKLGFGGAMTYERALQIRRLAQELPLDSIVLETDAPDIPPAWLRDSNSRRNEPAQLVQIAQTMSQLRNISLEALSVEVHQALLNCLPRLSLVINSI